MSDPIVTEVRELTIHAIKDKEQYKTLMINGDIKQGDMCLIEEDGDTMIPLTNTRIKELMEKAFKE